MTKKKVNIKGFFEQGFEAKDWKNATELPLPVTLKYLDHEEFESRFGSTMRYVFEDAHGDEVRLLCKGTVFEKAVEKFLAIGTTIVLDKNEKGYWVFDLA